MSTLAAVPRRIDDDDDGEDVVAVRQPQEMTAGQPATSCAGPGARGNHDDDDGEDDKADDDKDGNAACSYQELPRFMTWRKHVKDLYQQLFCVDLVWESAVAQLMPYATVKGNVVTHTILCGTRTSGSEQNYLQMLSATVPRNTRALDSALMPYCEATGEVGGYGNAPGVCGLKVERRIAHRGDVLAARYMHANPLLLASCSSDAHVYVFDWSRVSLNKFPNDPPRPRAPLPPNELSDTPTDEERVTYHKRMRELHAVTAEQDRWDRRTAEGQQVLTLAGARGASDNVDWNTSTDGLCASGSLGRLCVWQAGSLTKDAARTVQPLLAVDVTDDATGHGTRVAATATAADDNNGNDATVIVDSALPRMCSARFLWHSPDVLVCCDTAGTLHQLDVRTGQLQTLCTRASMPMSTLLSSCSNNNNSNSSSARNDKSAHVLPTCVSPSPLQSDMLLVGCDDGTVAVYDRRKSGGAAVDVVAALHNDEVTSLEWCPHTRHLFASASGDGNVCVYNVTRQQLLFTHTGHTDVVMDMAWNWQEDSAGQLVTTDSNTLMLWRPRDCFFYW